MIQAVILAGGRGSRLAPITDSIPKPMVDVNGKPFLAHLLDLLEKQGITRILILTGHRGNQIHEYFGSDGNLDSNISYSHGPEEWCTGERLFAARHYLDSIFLLLYADNYVKFDLKKMLEQPLDSSTSMILTVCPKNPGNIILSPEGRVDSYLTDRGTGCGEFVEVGFSLSFRDQVLEAIRSNEFSLPKAIESLTSAGRVRANVVKHPYFSVSDPERLNRTRLALKRRRLLLLDRDGVLNIKAPTGQYVTKWEEFKPIKASWDALITLSEQGFSFIVISNQAGVARGLVDPRELDRIHDEMLRNMVKIGLDVLGIYVCPHHWNDECFCRKPLPGLFYEAASEHSLLLEDLIYVGDDVRDEAAAIAAGCTSILIGPESVFATETATGQFEDFTQALPFIIGHYGG